MRMNKIIPFIAVATALQTAHPFAATNLFKAHSPTLRLAQAPKKCHFRVGANGEYGQSRTGRNADSSKVNVLNLFEASQSALAALEQPTDAVLNATDFINVRDQLRIIGARDDGTRSHIALSGKFEQWDVTPHVTYSSPIDLIPGTLSIMVALPIRQMRIDDVTVKDLTNKGAIVPAQDLATTTLLTDAIVANAKKFGGLDLGNWEQTGLGDLEILFGWANNYPQTKDNLENVELHAFIGFTAPTAEEKDENKAFSVALGNDSAWSLPLGIGLDLDFKHHIALGAEAQFEILFDDTKVRRIKTSPVQTEFLLFNKARVTKDHGLTWRFLLYAQGYHLWSGLSLKTAYEYVKHENDRLTPKSDSVSAGAVNSSAKLGEWNMHHFIFQLNYDFFEETKNFAVKPQLSLFYKLPIDGKLVLAPQTFGGQLAFNF